MKVVDSTATPMLPGVSEGTTSTPVEPSRTTAAPSYTPETISKTLLGKSIVKEGGKYTPREDQNTAIEKVVQGFAEYGRGQLILPCGTGKTFTSLWIKEEMQPRVTLVLVPSLSLLKQTKDRWDEQKQVDFNYLCVCSDKTVDEIDEDSVTVDLSTLGENVTEDPEVIKRYLSQGSADLVVYCTYQSLPRIEEAMKGNDLAIDLILADEAHKTAGSSDKLFALVHDNERIRANKRLYMTATPRILEGQDAEDEEAQLIYDMNNERIFGPVFHWMSFGEAITKEIIADYKLVVIGIDKSRLEELRTQYGDNAQEVLYNIALDKAMKEHNICHVLTFHSRKSSARDFSGRHQQLFGSNGIIALYVDGTIPVSEREVTMDKFKDAAIGVLSNARCLTEGVDIQKIDGVYFRDKKQSQVDLVQACSRAFRKDPDNPNKIGFILITIPFDPSEDIETAIQESSFKPLVDLLCALADHDERLVAELGKVSDGSSKGRAGTPDFIGTHIQIEGLKDALRAALYVRVISRAGVRTGSIRYGSFEEIRQRVYDDTNGIPPSNVTNYFSSPNLRNRFGIGLGTLKRLAGDPNITLTDLGDLIYDFQRLAASHKAKLLELVPERPKDLNEFFTRTLPDLPVNEFQLSRALGYKGKAFYYFASLLDRAERIWGVPNYDELYSQIISKLKTQYPERMNIFSFLTPEVYNSMGLSDLKDLNYILKQCQKTVFDLFCAAYGPYTLDDLLIDISNDKISLKEITYVNGRLSSGCASFKRLQAFGLPSNEFPTEEQILEKAFPEITAERRGYSLIPSSFTRGYSTMYMSRRKEIGESLVAAKDSYKKQCPTRPENLIAFFNDKSKMNMTFGCKRLEVEQALTTSDSLHLTVWEIADEIWGPSENPLEYYCRELRLVYPEKPADYQRFILDANKDKDTKELVSRVITEAKKTIPPGQKIPLGKLVWGSKK